MREPLVITVHLAPEDPRYVDLRRNVLAKLERAHAATSPSAWPRSGQSIVGSASDEAYGEIEYSYGGRSAKSRSTSHREILPLLYELAGRPIPAPVAGEDYPGYPLVADGAARAALVLRRASAPDRHRVVVEPPRPTHPAQAHRRRRSAMKISKSTIAIAVASVGLAALLAARRCGGSP